MAFVRYLAGSFAMCALLGAWVGCSDDEREPEGGGTTTGEPPDGPGTSVESDACPGSPIAMAVNQTITVRGSTAKAKDDFQPFCVDGSGPDRVFAITLSAAGTLDLSLTNDKGSPLDAVLYVNETCGSDGAEASCVDFGTSGETLKRHAEAGTYYVIVDGARGTSGAFDLTMHLGPPVCGDGVRNPEEECDDGNLDAGDGCASCSFEPTLTGIDQCPGDMVEVAKGQTLDLKGFTTGYADDYRGSCSPGTGGSDRVYQVRPLSDGKLVAKLGYDEDGVTPVCGRDASAKECWDRVLYVRGSECASDAAADELACSDNAEDGNAPESIELAVTKDNTYWVVVDGYDGESYSYGPYRLLLSLH